MSHSRQKARPPSLALGRRGERRALWFYRFRAFRVLERNFRSPRGEIDLIVRRFGLIVFVEVKTRTSLERGEPWEAVDREKGLRIARAAEDYIRMHRLEKMTARFDVLSIVQEGPRLLVTHYADTFRRMSADGRPWVWK